MSTDPIIAAPPAPRVRLCLGVTGHREGNAVFAANRGRIEAAMTAIFNAIDTAVKGVGYSNSAPTRLHCLLADGVDQLAANSALLRGWELVAPLPFGHDLNVAINALPTDAADARALLNGDAATDSVASLETQGRAEAVRGLCEKARCFELAEQDDVIAALFLRKLDAPTDLGKAQAFAARSSERVALAARVMIEQSDILIGVWDGATQALIGGTGHTIAATLALGAPVVWIDVNAPETWRILCTPESLAGISSSAAATCEKQTEALSALVRLALQPAEGRKSRHGHGHGKGDPHAGLKALDGERWRGRSSRFWHAYRRVEALFGAESLQGRLRNLRQSYETPAAIASGSAAAAIASARALPAQDDAYVSKIETDVLRRFAWADGISARLSDTYRGGMTLSFIFSALAIVGGIAYLPFATPHDKWMFALFELALLLSIVAITVVGQKRRWHTRWFETRRVAEYFRHAPILLLLGVARPTGRWPRGAQTSWPEWYARHGLRDLGLPQIVTTPTYLRGALKNLLLIHVVGQRDYHRYKAKRLAHAHHNLDKFSEVMFILAVASVSCYLVLKAGGALHWFDHEIASRFSMLLTFFGVLLPTFGGAIAGIRYFGDFERFSAISEVTAEKLDAVADRIELLLAAPDHALDYGRVSELAHAADDIVVGEIESWQAVFGGKNVTVPV